MDIMNIVLTSVDGALAAAWEAHCGDLDLVSVRRESIFDVASDAVVSPANSFGFMDGGLDMYYSQFFGWDVEARLQKVIRERHHGELLVGTAEIVETEHEAIPYLIAAPTMRVPMVLRESVNPYLAARAVLLLIKHGTMLAGPDAGKPISAVVKTVAFPGLGTGVGRIPPDVCARQVRAAIGEVLLGERGFPRTWVEAQDRHVTLYSFTGGRDLQRG
jgi:O-acetyl-ADP-ribose deacetylase (regulator of RNase III)